LVYTDEQISVETMVSGLWFGSMLLWTLVSTLFSTHHYRPLWQYT
jgi:hypothetical protein